MVDFGKTGAARPRTRSSELSAALRACRGAMVGTALLSGLINVLMLTGSVFMLEIYERGLPMRAGVLFFCLGVTDLVRGRLLVRIGATLDESIGERVYDTIVRLPLRAGN